jgi:hypothetical protein
MLNEFGKKVAAPSLILVSAMVQACRASKSTPSNATNRHHTNQTNTSEASAECDPNYSGCVPIASDVDCAGGSGNGPAYVKGPVKVIGKDIYGLDENRNGIGCE